MSYHQNWMWFKERLKINGMTQGQLAKVLNVERSVIQRFREFLRIPSNLFPGTAKALDVTEEKLEQRFSHAPRVDTKPP